MGFLELFWNVLQNVLWITLGLFGFMFAFLAFLLGQDLVIDLENISDVKDFSLWFVYFVLAILLFIFSVSFGLTCFVIIVRNLFLGG